MATLTISRDNLSKIFETSMFSFKMLSPKIREFRHEIQNGDTSIDRVSFKDRFEVVLPFLYQSEYNLLQEMMQSISVPLLTLEYETDGITRLWDGLTAYSGDIEAVLAQDPIYDYFDYLPKQGLLVARGTTNLITNPNGDIGDLTNVEVEDSVTTKKNLTLAVSSEQYLWGGSSFKASNTSGADFTPETGSAALVLSTEGRPDYSDSGALQITEGYTSYLLYNYAPFTTYGANWTHSQTLIMGGEVYGPNYCYRDETISPGSDTYTFQLNLEKLVAYGNAGGGTITLKIDDLAGQSNTFVLNIPQGWYYGNTVGKWVSVTKTFVASASATIRCRIDYSNIDLIYDSFGVNQRTELQLVKASYPLPWVDTTGGSPVAVGPYDGLLYKAPVGLWAYDGIHYEPPCNVTSETQSPQSISLWFRSTGWYYDQAYSEKFYIISSLDHTGHSGFYNASLYFENGYLKLTALGVSDQYLITGLGWEELSWHHIALVHYQEKWESVSYVARSRYNVYVDDELVLTVLGPYLSGLSTKFVGQKVDGSYERYFSIGRLFDLTLSKVASTSANMIFSEIVIGTSRFDQDRSINYPSLTILEALRSEKSISSYLSLIQYDENFCFYLQGDSTSAYIARCIFFKSTFTNDDIDKFVGSCYIYPTKSDHKRLLLIAPYSVVDSLASAVSYWGGETANNYTPDSSMSKNYLQNTWYRSSILSLKFAWPAGGTTSGNRRVFGVYVPIGEVYYICGGQFEITSDAIPYTIPEGPTPYCDGEQTNCDWDGTIFDSTSSRTTDYLKIAFPSDILNTDSWTLSFFATLPEMTYLPGEGEFITLGDGPTNKVKLRYRSDIAISYLQLVIVDNSGVTTTYTDGRAWVADREYAIAIVRDVVSNTLKVYIDYELVFTHTVVAIKRQLVNPNYLYPGSTGPLDASPVYSSIFIRKMSLWKQALDRDKLLRLNCAEFSTPDILPTSLSYYGSFSEDLILNSHNKINEDVKRLRKKVLISSFVEMAHTKNRANYYQMKLQFQES